MTNSHDEPRFLLNRKGLERLAALQGVSPDELARRTGAAFIDTDAGQTVEDVVPDVPHQLGVNAFTTQLVVDARRRGGEVGEFFNATMSTHRFVTSDGRRMRISPDGSGWFNFTDGQQSFLLEYEREEVDEDELRAKLVGYCHYYESSEWQQQFQSEPTLLFVCASDQAEDQVFRVLSRIPDDIPAFVTTDERYQRNRATALGVMGRIWRVPRSGEFGYAFELIGTEAEVHDGASPPSQTP